MTKEKNILQEAIADTKALKEAAYANAQSVLMEHLKENVKQFVDQNLNEALDETMEENVYEAGMYEGDEEEEGDGLGMDDELEVDVLDDEEDEEGSPFDSEEGDEEAVDEGLTEDDLAEALRAALSEVEHGGLGEMPLVVNGDSKSETGIESLDKTEDGWEAKTAPKAKPAGLHTGEQYHQESRKLRRKVVQLVKENVVLKKTNKKLVAAVREVKLFNAKLFYATKLMQREGLSAGVKQKIVRNMDKVSTLSEAKNLYSSLELALGLVSEGTKPKAKKRPSLTEALGSDVSAGTGRGVSNLNESAKHRAQLLAGIITE